MNIIILDLLLVYIHYYIESIFPDVIKPFIAIISTHVELNTIHDA